MYLLPPNIERILAIGGSVSIDATKYTPQSLERFAAFASQSGANLILHNCGMLLPQTMERIAAIGKGRIMFKLEK